MTRTLHTANSRRRPQTFHAGLLKQLFDAFHFLPVSVTTLQLDCVPHHNSQRMADLSQPLQCPLTLQDKSRTGYTMAEDDRKSTHGTQHTKGLDKICNIREKKEGSGAVESC